MLDHTLQNVGQRLGIVYTPVEVVDFIIHSVNDVLRAQFGQTLGSKGVHILDPFTGTGTFITRLLQSGLIAPDELEHKYKHEIHANEIVLLAYYIAAVNIESAFLDAKREAGLERQPQYESFPGPVLTDTFPSYEPGDRLDDNVFGDGMVRIAKARGWTLPGESARVGVRAIKRRYPRQSS